MNCRTLICLVIFSLLLAACAPGSPTPALPTPTALSRPVQQEKPTFTVRRGGIQIKVEVSGNIGVVERAELFFRSGGKVKHILTRVGEMVTQGQVLAELEGVDDLVLAQQSQALDLRRAEIYLAIAELNLQAFKDQWLSKRQIAYELPVREYEVELAKLDLEAVKLHAQDLSAQIADFQVIASMDGEVVSIEVSEGKDVEAYQTAISIADTGHQVIRIQPDQEISNELSLGMRVQFVDGNLPGKVFTGKITRLPRSSPSSEREADPAFQIEMDEIPEGSSLYDFVTVIIELANQEDALWLPPQAVRNFEGREFVVVIDGDSQRRVDILTGVRTQERVEILEGLNEGDIVVLP